MALPTVELLNDARWHCLLFGRSLAEFAFESEANAWARDYKGGELVLRSLSPGQFAKCPTRAQANAGVNVEADPHNESHVHATIATEFDRQCVAGLFEA